MLRIATGSNGPKQKGIWLPCDAYIGLGVNRKRLWDVPNWIGECRGQRAYWRLELCLLLNVVIVIDFRKH